MPEFRRETRASGDYREVLAIPAFRRLWLAEVTARVGEAIAQVALPLLVYRLTESAGLMSVIFVIQMLPRAILAPVDLPVLADLRIVNGALLAMEAAVFHGGMLRERSADYGEFARLRLLAAHAYAPGAYLRAQQARAELRRRFERECRSFDLLSTPTMPGPAPPLDVPAPTRFTAPFNLLGWPAITVPTGAVDRMPIGLQLVGRPWSEAVVLRAARVVERSMALP